MPVITFTTTKGGAGKTTAALVLASVLSDTGASVAMIDADPNHPLTKWAGKATLPDKFSVHSVDEENVLETIEEQSAQSQFVIVDLEGSANVAISYAMSLSTMVLIPIQASHLDADEATKTLKLVHRQRKTLQRDFPCFCFWQRASAAIQTKSGKDMQAQFAEAGIPILGTSLIERDAFRAMFAYKMTLMQMSVEQSASIAKAQQNGHAFAAEIIKSMKEKVA